MFGIGSTEMLGVLVTGEIWLKVPRTIRMQWAGRLARILGEIAVALRAQAKI